MLKSMLVDNVIVYLARDEVFWVKRSGLRHI